MTPERAQELFTECIKDYPANSNQLATVTRFANLCQADALDEVAAELDGQGVNSLAWKLEAKAAELRKQP